jgi:small membrane protein
MLPMQIVLLHFFVFAIIKVISRFRSGELSILNTYLWVIFWISAGVIAVFPNLTARFAEFLGVGRGADLIVYLALVSLFFIVFKLTIKIEKLNRELTSVVRNDALKK